MTKIIKSYLASLRSFDQGAVLVLALTTLLLPIFFWPAAGLPIDIHKKILIFSGTFLAVILWLAGRLQTGALSLPKNTTVLISAGLIISTLISSAFAQSPRLALFGLGLEQDTFWSLGVLLLLMMLISIYFQSKRAVINFFLVTIGVSAIVIVSQVLILLGWFWPSYFSNAATNLIGKWNSLGLFLGFIAIVSTVILETIALPSWRKLKLLLSSTLILSLVGLVMINFNLVWAVVGAVSLLISVYIFSSPANESKSSAGSPSRRVSKIALGLVICSLVFLLAGQNNSVLGRKITDLNTRLGVANLEVRPSWIGTWQIVKRALVEKGTNRPALFSTVVGVGPNNFAYEWGKYKPTGVNQTLFWNIDFTAGVGTLPSLTVGTGLLGLLLWILFLASLIRYGFRALWTTRGDRLNRSLVLLSFSATLYFWVLAITYVSDTVIFALAFITTGVFLGFLTGLGLLPVWSRGPGGSSGRSNIVMAVIMLALILLAIAGLYLGLEQYWSINLFRRGTYALNVENQLDKSQDLIARAVGHSEQSLYYRALVDLSLVRMNQILSNQNLPREQVLADFSRSLSIATTSANRAIYLDRANYLNYSYSGKLYQALVPLQIKGAYDWALASYREALKFNPSNPQAYIDLAQLEIANKNYAGAEVYVKNALNLKSNFTSAYLLLAQLNVEKGNVNSGINLLKQAAAADPRNTEILFQLGYLQFKNEDYRGAVTTLEQAIALVPNYSNAKYFLGLAYSKLGEVDKAVKQFTDILTLNPGNGEVENILNNLRAGRAPFAAKK